MPDDPPRLRTADFDFHLPPELIAQRPAERRDESRLMIVERDGGRIVHARFGELAGLIPAGATRGRRPRCSCCGRSATGGGRRWCRRGGS